MEIFLLRHGQTSANRQRVHQALDTPLDVIGWSESERVADRLRVHEPTLLLSSPVARAYETAEILATRLQLRVESWPELAELTHPASIVGLKHASPKVLWYMWRWFTRRSASSFAGQEGESLANFFARIKSVQARLEDLPVNGRVVVVTHSVFIIFFLLHLQRSRPVPVWRALIVLCKVTHLKNSSITRLYYAQDETTGEGSWEFLR